jgi:hypothetical protein
VVCEEVQVEVLVHTVTEGGCALSFNMGFFNTLTSTAVSFVVGGNTGISPFLSLFLVGIVERCNSKLLNMSGFTEALLSSYAGLTFLGAATVLEFVSHCVPVVDQIIDSIMTFVVPIMSVLGMFGMVVGVNCVLCISVWFETLITLSYRLIRNHEYLWTLHDAGL